MDNDESFEHTGIRIMKGSNGDLLLCDPGAVTGIRDSLMLTKDLLDSQDYLFIGRAIIQYIEKHERTRNEPEFDQMKSEQKQ